MTLDGFHRADGAPPAGLCHPAGMRRPVVVFLYLAILVGESMWNAIVPLLPAFSERFALSKVEAGVLLASTSLAILIVSIPAGVLGERFGVRRLTLLAIVLMAVADLGQGLAGSSPRCSPRAPCSGSASASSGRPAWRG